MPVRSKRRGRQARARRRASQSGSGYALTVFRSPAVSRFPLQVNGETRDGGVSGLKLILARAEGEVIETIGGVPAGASGSPVYIGNQLLGAISTLFYPDPKLVGITPREAMLRLADEPLLPSDIAPVGFQSSLQPPVTAIGISSGRILRQISQRYGSAIVGGEARQPVTVHELPRPGSAIGAALLLGDIRLGFVGTTTLVDGQMLFAFGHPLLYAGPTSMPLTEAIILDVARGSFPNKVADLGAIIGTVIQDRAAGILAYLGQMPDLVEMKFTIKDEDRGQTEIVQVQATRLNSELPFLVLIATLESMQRAMNRVGPGTAIWEWVITLQGAAEPMRITEIRYDPNIGFTLALQIETTVRELLENGQVIEAIELRAAVTARRTSN
ncbi:MAG: hypothetical protein ACOX18_07715 [Bacillota bacterium]